MAASKGFSLIELVVILIMISALAVVAYPRFANTAIEEAAFEQELLNALRYAHKQAMNTGCAVRIEVRAASNDYGVYLRDDATATSCGTAGFGANPMADPSGGTLEGQAPRGVTISSGLSVTFDGLGRPGPGGGTINFNGRSIVVAGETGYVYAP